MHVTMEGLVRCQNDVMSCEMGGKQQPGWSDAIILQGTQIGICIVTSDAAASGCTTMLPKCWVADTGTACHCMEHSEQSRESQCKLYYIGQPCADYAEECSTPGQHGAVVVVVQQRTVTVP